MENKKIWKILIIFVISVFLLLHLLDRVYNYMFPEIKEDKIMALVSIGDKIKKQNSNLGIQLDIYAIDCRLGQEKISYVIIGNFSEIYLRKEYNGYNCYMITYKDKTYINIEKNNYLNKLYPFFDFLLYTKFGKSFGIYIKAIIFYIVSACFLIVVYKPLIDYNKKTKKH